MKRDAELMRGIGPTVFAQVKHKVGLNEIIDHIHSAMNQMKRSKN